MCRCWVIGAQDRQRGAPPVTMPSDMDLIDEAFVLFDSSGTGELSYGDCKTAVRALAKIGGFPSEKELDAAIGDSKTVRRVNKAKFTQIMTGRAKAFAAAGGTVYLNSSITPATRPVATLPLSPLIFCDYQ